MKWFLERRRTPESNEAYICVELLRAAKVIGAVQIRQEKCLGCIACIPYCPMHAISIVAGKKASIDLEKCTECYACLRASVCPTDAIEETSLTWPRSLRRVFGAVQNEHKETKVPGRGTEEMKTNDVTGRFEEGEVGFSVDIGRPGVGATFADIETIATEIAGVGVEFEPMNPVTYLMSDRKTGKLQEEIKGEKVHSCVMEFKTKVDRLPEVVHALNRAATKVNTVFSAGCCCRVGANGQIAAKSYLDRNHISYRPNGKTNIGLGRAATVE